MRQINNNKIAIEIWKQYIITIPFYIETEVNGKTIRLIINEQWMIDDLGEYFAKEWLESIEKV